MNRNASQWRILDDCLTFDGHLLQQTLAEATLSSKQRRLFLYVDAGSQVLRQALEQCLSSDHDYTPSLAHHAISSQLCSKVTAPIVQTLCADIHADVAPLHSKKIIRVTRSLLEDILPLKNQHDLQPDQELPDRVNMPELLVRHLIDTAFLRVQRPNLDLQAIRHLVIQELGDHGTALAAQMIREHFPHDEQYSISSFALVAAAIMEVNRRAPKDHTPLTVESFQKRARVVPTLEA